MGKRILVQRLGKGSPAFRVPDHRYKVEKVSYAPQKGELMIGEVVDIFHDRGRSYPVAEIRFADGTVQYVPAAEGLGVGDIIEMGPAAKVSIGNILPLFAIPEGTPIFNIEGRPGDGGKYVRASGTYAVIVGKTENSVIVQLPSRKTREFNPFCRATIGAVAGGGRVDKPLVKAGKAYYKYRVRNKRWPRVRGVHMNPVDHPHGGKEHHPPGATTVARNTPPGRKVGHIAARRTGRRKR